MTEHLVREGGRICIGRELTLFEKKPQFTYECRNPFSAKINLF